jgi:serine/threonine protein kinase
MPLEALQHSRYRRLRLLGSGGMGEVYLMEDSLIGRQVAIKVMRTDAGAYPDNEAVHDAARLFQREARAIAVLEHPNILPLYDFGEEEVDGSILTYMVMPFCPESSLDAWLRRRGAGVPFSQDGIALLVQAADALQYAHDHHVIHLDVKPANFLLRGNLKQPGRPTLLLADFGVARLNVAHRSSSQEVRGTPNGMAPEQWAGSPAPASDQYALAVMAFMMLTGHPPFAGSMEQLMYQHFNVQPQPPSLFNPQLPPAFDAIILRALSKRPEERFPSIAAFASALEYVAQNPQPRQRQQPRPPPSSGPVSRPPESASADSPSVADLPTSISNSGLPLPDIVEIPTLQQADSAGNPVTPQPALRLREAPASKYSGGSDSTQPEANGQPIGSSQRRKIALVVLALLLLGSGIGIYSAASMYAPATISRETFHGQSATVAALRDANPDPYPSGDGTLALYDPLRGNASGNQWSDFASNSYGRACQFKGGAYHVSEISPGYFNACTARGNFSNFAFEVHMQIERGNCGGMIFRANTSSSALYYFGVCQNGLYDLYAYVDRSAQHARKLAANSSPAIHAGLKQANVIAVVADGHSLDLYVNHKKIAGVNDGSYNAGTIGLLAYAAGGSAVEVIYSDARLWTLS